MLSALGRTAFEDASIPVPGKSEFGMDTLVRKMEGFVGENGENLIAFIQGLNQGDTYAFGDAIFYLQTWSPDDGKAVATVTLNYKGLKPGGTPEPDIETEIVSSSGQTGADYSSLNDGLGLIYRNRLLQFVTIDPGTGEQTVLTANNIPVYATGSTLEFIYDTAQTTYRYITTGKPNGARYEHIDIPFVPVIKEGRTRMSDGAVYNFQGPIAVGPAIQPVPEERVVGFNSKHVIGSPYYECVDVIRMELVQPP